MNLLSQTIYKRYYLKAVKQGDRVMYSVLCFDLSPELFEGNVFTAKAKVLRNGRVFDTANHALEYVKKYFKHARIPFTPYWENTLKRVNLASKVIMYQRKELN